MSLTSCAPQHFVDLTDESVSTAFKAKIAMLSADDAPYSGRVIEIEGRRLLNFGGCSYLGLEQHAALRNGAIEAINRYGTQFSFSRVFVESPLYSELESLISRMTGGYALVTPSTSLGHISALPVIVGRKDAFIIDRSAHASVHTAIALLRDVPVEILPHNRLDLLEQSIVRLKASHERIWYGMDGLYSMVGDFAPLADIVEIMKRHPELHLYVDDAHATTWHGQNGRGYTLSVLTERERERVVVALSLNKAFSAAGGALVFANPEDRARVRRCGGPLLFSGPVQPPMLGAAIASAKLQLDPSFANMQAELEKRMSLTVELSSKLGIPLANSDLTPIFFVRCGTIDPTTRLILALRDRGFYVSPGLFPAVPHDKSGPRFTISLSNTFEDIEAFLHTLAEEARRQDTPFRSSVFPKMEGPPIEATGT